MSGRVDSGLSVKGDQKQPFAVCTFMIDIDPTYAGPMQYQQRQLILRPSKLSAESLAPQKDANLRKYGMVYA